MRTKLTLCCVFLFFSTLMATTPVCAAPQYNWYSGNGASTVETPKSEGDAFYVKYSTWFTEVGGALNAAGRWLLRPFTNDGMAVCDNLLKSNDLWEVVAHLFVALLLLGIVPLLVIAILQFIYRGFVVLLCLLCDKLLWLRIDSSSEFFYFVAYLLFSFLFASGVTTAVMEGQGFGALRIFLLGSSITSIVFVLAMVLHFRKKKLAKFIDVEAAAEPTKPEKTGEGEVDEPEIAANASGEPVANEPKVAKGLLGVRILDIMVEFHWSLILMFVFPFFVKGPFEFRAMIAGFIILAVALHEIGHALVAKAFGNRICGIVLDVFGGYTAFRSSRIRGDILVSLAGPLTNLLFAGIFGCFDWVTLAKVNLVLGCVNLLPIWPLDGSKVLYSILRKCSTRNKARGISGIVGIVTGIGLIAYLIAVHCSVRDINWFSLIVSTLVATWLTFSSFCLLGTLKFPDEGKVDGKVDDKKDEPDKDTKNENLASV